MNDRDFFPRFYDTEGKVMLYWQCYMQSAFNRLTDTRHFGLLYNLLRNPNIVKMRCTGLKDKNGKLIYEGDIVITYYKGEPTGQMYIYHWEAPAFYVEPVEKGKPSGRHYYYFAVENERCEVIGNVHENSDLLKNPGNFNVSGENVKGDN